MKLVGTQDHVCDNFPTVYSFSVVMRIYQTNPNQGICYKVTDQAFQKGKDDERQRLWNCHMLEETKMGSMQHGIYLDPKSERNFSGKSGEI